MKMTCPSEVGTQLPAYQNIHPCAYLPVPDLKKMAGVLLLLCWHIDPCPECAIAQPSRIYSSLGTFRVLRIWTSGFWFCSYPYSCLVLILIFLPVAATGYFDHGELAPDDGGTVCALCKGGVGYNVLTTIFLTTTLVQTWC